MVRREDAGKTEEVITEVAGVDRCDGVAGTLPSRAGEETLDNLMKVSRP